MSHGGCACQQGFLKFDARDAQARANVAPEFLQIRLAKQVSLLVEETPSADLLSGSFDCLTEAERSQDAHAVRGKVNSCPDRRPRHATFNEFRRKTVPMQGGSDRKTGYSSPNDQDPFNIGHVASPGTLGHVIPLGIGNADGVLSEFRHKGRTAWVAS